MTRSITFAGRLGPGDCSADGELVSIDRKPRDFRGRPPVLGDMPEEAVAEAAALLAKTWRPCPEARRSPRPGRMLDIGWSPAFMGAGIEEIPRTEQFAALVADFEPDADLEAWLLPVTGMSFPFLVTPADPP